MPAAPKDPRWGEAVRAILDENSYREAESLTGVSYTVIWKWAKYNVLPTTAQQVRAFADGLKEPRLPLLIAAGYMPTLEDCEHDLAIDPNNAEGYQAVRGLIENIRLVSRSEVPSGEIEKLEKEGIDLTGVETFGVRTHEKDESE